MEAIFRPALILMFGRGLGFIATFAIPMVLSRVFTLEEFGTYKQLFLIYATLFGIAQVGMAESLYYFLPVKARRGGGYVMNTLLMMTVVGMLCLLGMWLGQAYLARLLNNPDLLEYIPYVGLYLLFMLLSVVLEIIMTVKKQHKSASLTFAFSDLLRAICIVAPVLMFADMHWLMLGAVGFAIMRFGATLAYVGKEFGRTLRRDGPLMRKHLGYALPFGLAGLIEVAQVNLHMYAVSYYFDVVTFAIYAVGCLQVPLIDFLSTSTSNVMMVNMREKVISKDLPAVLNIWLDTTRKLALIFFPLVFGLLVIAHELIVMLFTSTYEASVPIFMVWTVSMLFGGILTDGVLRVFAETRFLILQNLVHLALMVSMIHFFLMTFGVLGAVLVTLLTTFLIKVFSLWRIKHILGVSTAQLLPWKSLGNAVAIAALASVPALLVKAALVLPGPLVLLVTGATYTISYYCLLVLMGPMDSQEKDMLMQTVHAPVHWLLRTCNLRF